MTKNEIVNYVVETPHNVNKRILGQQLDELQKNVSWNDLKDKPFGVVTESFTDVYLDFPRAGQPVINPFNIELVEGQTYEVTWDGVLYSCVAYIEEQTNCPAIGTGELAGASGGNGEPFCCIVFKGDVLLFANTVGAHTISMPHVKMEKIQKLDAKYLPEIGTDVKVVLTTPRGVKLYLEVDDDGQLYLNNPDAV